MEITFNYIRNRIREHSKKDLLQACYNILDDKRKEPKPIWFVFLLMKWTYLYGEEKFPLKELNNKRLTNILNSITNFNQDHIGNFIKDGSISRAFQILYSQQFYLQTSVYIDKFATQLKIYDDSLKAKYDINKSFYNKTGLSVLEFLQLLQLSWLYINIDELKNPNIKFKGYFGKDFLTLTFEVYDKEKVLKFLRLLVLDPINPNEKINEFKRNLKNEELQSLERTFFTLYPLQVFNGNFKLIHKSIFNYCANYYIYDYLKSNDNKFTTEFGLRFEKYIELGIIELKYSYKTENQLKKILPKHSNLVDFLVEDNILIECKAIELQAYTSINPTDELIYSSLKDSILKAYFKQLLTVSKHLNNGENWGIILTYKKLYWSQFSDLYEVGKAKFPEIDNEQLPPENVFIIDIYTWDRIVNIINNEKTSLIRILEIARTNNSDPITKKQSFDMHLDIFDNNALNLNYLKREKDLLKISK